MKLFSKSCLVLIILSALVSADEAPFSVLDSKVTGVDFSHPLDEEHPQAFLYHSGFAVGGIALGDVNGDGGLDLYLVSGPGENHLYLGDGKLSFERASLPVSGIKHWGTGASLVDIDNDGDLDLFQCNYDAPNQLLLNDGSGVFTDCSKASGLAVTDASMTPSFADVDNDGDLDLFLMCNRYYNPDGRTARPPIRAEDGKPVVLDEFQKYYHLKEKSDGGFDLDDYGRADYFFLNTGTNADGVPQFKDVSEESGLRQKGFGLSCTWWDYDSDGDLDLYLANDFTVADRLYRNDGTDSSTGVPKFTDVIAKTFPSVTWSSMGSDFADVNNDGLPDLISVDMSASTHFKAKLNMGALPPKHRLLLESGSPRQAMRNHLFINRGGGMFAEAAWALGVASTDWSWTAKFGDLDNDGWQDLFVSNGIARNFSNADHSLSLGDLTRARVGRTEWEIFKDTEPMIEKNLAMQNVGGKKFKEREDWGLGLVGMSYSAAMGDLDNDGDLDLVVSDLGKNVKMYKNSSNSGKHLRVKLVGGKSNRMGIGSKVVVTDSAGEKRTRWMNPWTGFQSQNDPVLHFGLGDESGKIVEVQWPSGTYQQMSVPDGASEILVTELANGEAPVIAAVTARFSAATAPEFKHEERSFDDFERQPLLPSKLSQLGPCLAAGDMDGDGDDDFYVGGAQRQRGVVFVNNGGKFTATEQPGFSDFARFSEDSAALWFDADGDGNLDLLVVSGSTELEPGHIMYRDRLYLNPGDGKPLQLAEKGTLPDLRDSGSCAGAADYDGDGDLDLFIGSRSIPGKYPLAPESRLLRNDSRPGAVKFTEVTPDAIKSAGMVTDARWSDFNRDGYPDLALATDWGPVRVFENRSGTLVDVSEAAGTVDASGWWLSLAEIDIDGDGDLDLVAGNTGLNTKYKQPHADKPVMIYYGDMDGSGQPRIVEAKKQKDKDRPLPVRGRS